MSEFERRRRDIQDRRRNREEGRDPGWAPIQGADPRQQIPAGNPYTEAAGGLIPAEVRPVRSAEAEEAYNLGQRMGAMSLVNPDDAGQNQPTGMTKERIREAEHTLLEYKKGKASIDQRIIKAQEWWKLRNWEQIQADRGTRGIVRYKSSTAWLWNCIVGKHADAIDSYPEPVILPRVMDDKAEAQILSEIIPVVLQMNDFEQTYNDCMWQKMQEGTAAYHVAWDKTKLGGIGDINIARVNMLNLFWEPGVNDIQDSENVFYVKVMDNRRLEQQYPQLKGKLKNPTLKPSEYRKDDTVTMDNKSVVVDWYYHTWEGSRKILQFCQFVNEEILYSTEDAGDMLGLYEDGDYPFVLDPLYPVEGSPAGYGYIDIGKDAQTDIDTLNQAMVQNAIVTSTPRHFIRDDGGINEDEFADWSRPFVHVNGNLGEDSIRQIQTVGIQGSAMSMLQQKIDELKFVTGNTDVNNGGVPSGVTAASAIAALKEDSGRSSKDSTKAAYRAYNKIVTMVIERIRQFYDIPRQFRILGMDGKERFVTYSNKRLQEQQLEGGIGLPQGMRRPVFDIDVRAQRENAYTKMSQNELALQFMNMGVFSPQMADMALMMLDMMDFKGKDELVQKIQANGTMREVLMKVGQVALALAQKYQPEVAQQLAEVLQGVAMEIGGGIEPAGGDPAQAMQTQTRMDDAMDAPPNMQENRIVARAKERAANASRPD